MLYKGLKGAASIYLRMTLSPTPMRYVKNHHSLAFQAPFANTDIYKSSLFPRLLEIGILLQILSFLLLKVQKILLLSLLLL